MPSVTPHPVRPADPRQSGPAVDEQQYSLRDVVDIKWRLRGSGADPFDDDLDRQAAFLDYLWREEFSWSDPSAQTRLQGLFQTFEQVRAGGAPARLLKFERPPRASRLARRA